MGAAPSSSFFEEPRWCARSQDSASGLRVAASVPHFNGQFLDVDLVDELGAPTSFVSWTFTQWLTVASCKFAFRARNLHPYIRNLPASGEMRRRCLRESPFPHALALEVDPTLFMGSAGSRARLHVDGLHTAIRVLHGQKLVVMIDAEVGSTLSAAEIVAVNSVLCKLADQAEDHFLGFAKARGRRTGRTTLGSLVLQYDWLGPGDAITIPQGWHHFIHNQTLCISAHYWVRPLQRAREASPHAGDFIHPPASTSQGAAPEEAPPEGEQPTTSVCCGLSSLSRGLLTSTLQWCIADALPTGPAPLAASGLVAASRAMRAIACSDELWKVAFRHHFGEATAMQGAGADGSTSSSNESWRERHLGFQRLLAEGFAEKPKAALRTWAEWSLIQLDSPDTIARFLRFLERHLDRVALGSFLGDCREPNKSVYVAYMQQVSGVFCDLSLEASLRLYLSWVRLPGEAPKIDRMFETLAMEYCRRNPSVFSSLDVAFILLFSMVMLSTDLHSPRIRRKMTPEEFVSSNRGIDGGNDVPTQYLLDIYQSIKQTPLDPDHMQQQFLALPNL